MILLPFFLMSCAACYLDIFIRCNNCFNCCCQSIDDIVQRHARHVPFVNALGSHEWNMNESALFSRVFVFTHISDTIQDMVADECACCIGNGCRNTCFMNLFHHCLNRQGREVSCRAVRKYRFINRLVTFIVLNSAVITVDADSFYCNIWSSSSLTDGKNDIRIAFSNLCVDFFK